MTALTLLLRRGAKRAYAAPLLAGLLTGLVVGIVFVPLPLAAGEDATRLERAFGVGIGAFVCTSVLYWWFGRQNERLYRPDGDAARARLARREHELAALSRPAIALRVLGRGLVIATLFGIVTRLFATESTATAALVGIAFGAYMTAMWAWGIWSARNMPVFTHESEET